MRAEQMERKDERPGEVEMSVVRRRLAGAAASPCGRCATTEHKHDARMVINNNNCVTVTVFFYTFCLVVSFLPAAFFYII